MLGLGDSKVTVILFSYIINLGSLASSFCVSVVMSPGIIYEVVVRTLTFMSS